MRDLAVWKKEYLYYKADVEKEAAGFPSGLTTVTSYIDSTVEIRACLLHCLVHN